MQNAASARQMSAVKSLCENSTPAKTKRFLIHWRGRMDARRAATTRAGRAVNTALLTDGGSNRPADTEQVEAEPDLFVGVRAAHLAVAVDEDQRELVALEAQVDAEAVFHERVAAHVPVRRDVGDEHAAELRAERALQEVRALLGVVARAHRARDARHRRRQIGGGR